MNEKNSRYAHGLMSKDYANIPEWEKCSDRLKEKFSEAGDAFKYSQELQEQLEKSCDQIFDAARAVEDVFREEIGDLVSRPQVPLDTSSLQALLESLESDDPLDDNLDESDFGGGEPTIH